MHTFLFYQAGLRAELGTLKEKEYHWLERMDIVATIPTTVNDEENGLNQEDDFKREIHL